MRLACFCLLLIQFFACDVIWHPWTIENPTACRSEGSQCPTGTSCDPAVNMCLPVTARLDAVTPAFGPTAGGITLALIAQQLEAYDLKSLGWHTAPAVHLMAESMRRAFAVRNSALGDPDFIQVDQPALLAPSFSAELRRTIVTDHATPSSEVKGLPAPAEHRQTTHFSVADADGNAVALTTTINGWYGSAVTVTGAGFLLNNEMDDFAAKPGTPNMYGLVQGEANAIRPGKRMLSAMTPSIVFGTDGKAELITGASGGPFIITTVFQAISNYLDYGLDASALMQAPRMHHQHLPDSLLLETAGFDASVLTTLRGFGHTVRDVADVDGGSISATIQRRGGTWMARARAFWDRPKGSMNSSSRISPGCGLGRRSSSVMVVDNSDVMRPHGIG